MKLRFGAEHYLSLKLHNFTTLGLGKHIHLIDMPFLVFALFLSSCCPQRTENNCLPDYGEMGAAADAGQFVAPEVPAGL
jgi:hypothetical protein